MKKLTPVVVAVAATCFLVSCKEKNSSAQNSAEVVSQAGNSEEEAAWFMAQTDYANVASVTATSELVEAQFGGKYLYPPINILDGDFKSIWCEADTEGPGIGEEITVEFSEPVSFDEIQIVNGFSVRGKTYDSYYENNRVKEIRLTQVAGKHFQRKNYELKDDCRDWQSIKFELTQTAQTINIKIVDIYKGTKYDDTCLDDIRLLYEGKVIPFKNVEALKKVQEENSKLMLKENAAGFENQFAELFGGSKKLVLKSVNGNSSLVIHRYSTDNRVVIDDIEYDGYRSYADYKLSNYRITKTEQVGYVEVKTVMLLKIDGNNVYINGVHYRVSGEN